MSTMGNVSTASKFVLLATERSRARTAHRRMSNRGHGEACQVRRRGHDATCPYDPPYLSGQTRTTLNKAVEGQQPAMVGVVGMVPREPERPEHLERAVGDPGPVPARQRLSKACSHG